jgi:hypothetical protein
MRKIASQVESHWMNTIKKALARKRPGLEGRNSTHAKPAAKKTSKKNSAASREA